MLTLSRSVVFLALCLLAFTSTVVIATDPYTATCDLGDLKFYVDSSTPTWFFDYVTSPGQLNYIINTPQEFTTGQVYLGWDIQPTIPVFNSYPAGTFETTVTITVNSHPEVVYNYPIDMMRYLASGFDSLDFKCTVENVLQIRVRQHVLIPSRETLCNYLYVFQIVTSTSVCGDPQFVGLRGQSFQIHGIDGAVYNLISTQDYALNSQFKFLTGPRPCPTMPSTGKKSSSCWSHDGSYLENIAFVTSADEKFSALSGDAATGFSEIKLNDRELMVGETLTFSNGHIFVNSTHELTIQLGVFYMEIENVDGFVNLRRVRVERENWHELSANSGAHGLLGQTWQNKRYSGKVPEIQGSPDDYVVDDNSLFSTSFPFSRMIN